MARLRSGGRARLAYRPMSDGAVAAGRSSRGARPGGPSLQSAAPDGRAIELRALRRGGCRVLAAPELCDEAERLGLLEPDGLARLLARAEPGPAGRAPTARVALAGERALLFRRSTHGGALARLWGDRWLGTARAEAELRAAARLLAAGAPVARPALVAGERRRGVWRIAVATWYEPRALDARAFLTGTPDPARVARAASAAGAALRRFHDAGGRHRELHAGNLLLREDAAGVEALLVDLDRARCGRPPRAPARFAEIMRLYRSLAKRDLASAVGHRGCAAFLRAYTGTDRGLRRALLRNLRRERRRLAFHRLAWGTPL